MRAFSLTTAKILRIIADEKSMGLFRTIFSSGGGGGGIDSENLQGKTNLTQRVLHPACRHGKGRIGNEDRW